MIMSSHCGHLGVARLLCGAGANKDKAVQTTMIGSSRCKHLQETHLLCGAGADKGKAMQIALSLCHVTRCRL